MVAKKLYVSYNEDLHGSIEEAVRISKDCGCLAWFDAFLLKNLNVATDIIIRISGEERYFRGRLLAICSPTKFDAHFMQGEANHRPSNWREKENSRNFRSVLYIHGLKAEIGVPPEVNGHGPPQHPTFI